MAAGVTPAKQHLFGFKSFQIDKSQPLGLGSYGAVYKAKCDQLPCAAKVLHPTIVDLDPSNNDAAAVKIKDRFRQECALLAKIRHPNIVQYLAMTKDPESRLTVLLMELIDESLTKMLERSTQSLAYYIQVDICHDIALAIAYLHSHNIMHRDIESNNVLISAGRRAKVTDFGMAKLDLVDTAPNMKRCLTMCPGTLAYMSPEALRDPPTYTKKLDCFSQGVVMIQVCTRLFPDPGPRTQLVSSPDSTQMIEVSVLETERRKEHIDMIDPNHALLPIAMECLKDDERERPSSEELCQRLAGLKDSHHYRDNARQHQEEIQVKDDQIKSQRQQLLEKERAFQDNKKVILEKDTMIQKMEKVTQKKEKEIASKERQLQLLNQQLQEQEQVTAKFQEIILTLQSQVEQLKSQVELLSCKLALAPIKEEGAAGLACLQEYLPVPPTNTDSSVFIRILRVEEKPLAVKTEVEEEAVTVTKDETTSAQPTVASLGSQSMAESEQPELKDILRELSTKVSNDWEDIGIHLNIEEGILKQIKSDNPSNSKACLREMFRMWLCQVDPPPSWSAVADAMVFVGREDIAVQLKKKYCVQTQ